jgi:hypothetical protein
VGFGRGGNTLSVTSPLLSETSVNRRARWCVGDLGLLTAAGPLWLVIGCDGGNVVRAIGSTQAEAW